MFSGNYCLGDQFYRNFGSQPGSKFCDSTITHIMLMHLECNDGKHVIEMAKKQSHKHYNILSEQNLAHLDVPGVMCSSYGCMGLVSIAVVATMLPRINNSKMRK